MSDNDATNTTLASVDPKKAQELIESGATLVDVRLDYEWEAGHIAGAQRIEMNDLVASADSLPKDKPIVFYCRAGNRSSMPTVAFREAGYDAYNVEGGLVAWVEAGLPIEPADGTVADVRPR